MWGNPITSLVGPNLHIAAPNHHQHIATPNHHQPRPPPSRDCPLIDYKPLSSSTRLAASLSSSQCPPASYPAAHQTLPSSAPTNGSPPNSSSKPRAGARLTRLQQPTPADHCSKRWKLIKVSYPLFCPSPPLFFSPSFSRDCGDHQG